MTSLRIFVMIFVVITSKIYAQHEPKAWIIGINANTLLSNPQKIGGNFQISYAHNCYTTFINEVSIFPFENKTAFEVSSSVNSILNNFKKQRIILTGGVGLSLTSVTLTKEELKNRFLAISGDSNKNHLSVLVKLRALFEIKPNWNFVTSINLKTLGSDFINFSTGINYEFPYRR